MNTINASEIKGDIPEGAEVYMPAKCPLPQCFGKECDGEKLLWNCSYASPFWAEVGCYLHDTILKIIYDTDKPYIPEVGEECEVCWVDEGNTGGTHWTKGILKGRFNNEFWFGPTNGYPVFAKHEHIEFRPIQSEEDKTREWMNNVVVEGARDTEDQLSYGMVIDLLIKAGVKIPEGEK